MAARKRKNGESFEDYRKNLKEEDILQKRRLRGRIIWNNGTYVRSEH